jgi:hypothetical protein
MLNFRRLSVRWEVERLAAAGRRHSQQIDKTVLCSTEMHVPNLLNGHIIDINTIILRKPFEYLIEIVTAHVVIHTDLKLLRREIYLPSP